MSKEGVAMPRFVSGKKRTENIESDGESIEQQVGCCFVHRDPACQSDACARLRTGRSLHDFRLATRLPGIPCTGESK